MKHFGEFSKSEVKKACDKAYAAYDGYMADINREGLRIVEAARAEGKKIIVLAGRPYHADPEINHGIHKLILLHIGFA